MIRVGINGFGRIGRALTRIISDSPDIKLAAINEIDPLIDNHAYLFSYYSIYGRFKRKVEVKSSSNLLIDGKEVKFYSQEDISVVPWHRHDVDVVIDATGIHKNVLRSRRLLVRGIKKVVITHSPEEVDLTIILGANEEKYNSSKHHIISSSICDATAVAPVLKVLDKKFKIKNCFFTTLHPWLSYQNVLDGSLESVSSPGHYWRDYGLGRSGVGNLIPKDTTAAYATIKVLPRLKNKIEAISFRIPTHIVASSDITAIVKKKTTIQKVNSLFNQLSLSQPKTFGFVNDHLVSLDYLSSEKSTFVDARWTRVLAKNIIKLVIWYDNEWGYSSRVLDIVRFILKGN
ncbi:MAG: glyceraldehyde 3-phosphate dehydrogenase NAD-binding domain-containing protein [Candidatus Omnitrophota bacterium]|nr:glyceraldehyde 3-phosphate dehydrogenase NAD-binding domain-containing protein [Candidatus Omnitrophota bacterium]